MIILCTYSTVTTALWGGVIFKEKYWTHFMLCQIVTGPQFQNFTLKFCFLARRRASENVDSYPKMGEFLIFVFNIF